MMMHHVEALSINVLKSGTPHARVQRGLLGFARIVGCGRWCCWVQALESLVVGVGRLAEHQIRKMMTMMAHQKRKRPQKSNSLVRQGALVQAQQSAPAHNYQRFTTFQGRRSEMEQQQEHDVSPAAAMPMAPPLDMMGPSSWPPEPHTAAAAAAAGSAHQRE